MSRKVTTSHLQIKSIKNASSLATDAKGNLIEGKKSKVTTTQLQIKGVKNAKVLGTDERGFVIEGTSDGIANTKIDIQEGRNITIDKTNPLKPVINTSAGFSGVGTDLSYTADQYKGTINSSTGNSVDIPLAENGVAGLLQYEKLNIPCEVHLEEETTNPSAKSLRRISTKIFVRLQRINNVVSVEGVIEAQTGVFIDHTEFSKGIFTVSFPYSRRGRQFTNVTVGTLNSLGLSRICNGYFFHRQDGQHVISIKYTVQPEEGYGNTGGDNSLLFSASFFVN